MTTETKVYRKDDVWLYNYDGIGLKPTTIKAIHNGYIHHNGGWESAGYFNAHACVKLGVVRIILGIPCGIATE